jgi:polysaccharide export outer membrane protein
MNLAKNLAFAVGILLPLVCQAQDQQKADTAIQSPSGVTRDPKPAGNSPVIPTDPDYKIGPMDLLRIDVWKEPDISRLVPVRPDGKISLPLLNDIQAAGLTAAELSGQIANKLKEFITNPQVTVGVAEINSRRVYITGEVSHPGSLPLLPNMTVLQALSSAGGFTQFAKLKGIYVLRTENGKKVKYPFNYKDVVGGRKEEQDIELKSGDIIVVP